MKKITKFLSIMACAVVVALSGLLLGGCGGGKPYSLAGTTLRGTSECIIVWGESATQQDKEALWAEFGVTNDEDCANKYAENAGDFHSTMTFVFAEDGTVSMTYKEHEEPETHVFYYVQSEDLKSVQMYYNQEYTHKYLPIKFINGKYYLNATPDSEYDMGIYIALVKE